MPCCEGLGLVTDLAAPIALGGFYQKHSKVTVSGFGDGQAIQIVAAGIFSGNQSEIGGILGGFGEALEVSGFNDYREGGDGFDAKEAGKLLNIFLVLLPGSKLFHSVFDPVQLARQIVIGEEILIQCFTSGMKTSA